MSDLERDEGFKEIEKSRKLLRVERKQKKCRF